MLLEIRKDRKDLNAFSWRICANDAFGGGDPGATAAGDGAGAGAAGVRETGDHDSTTGDWSSSAVYNNMISMAFMMNDRASWVLFRFNFYYETGDS